MAEKVYEFTGQGLEAAKERLELLKTKTRKEVSEKIKEARSFGDLSENAEYDEARNEQAEVEAEIMKLEEMIKFAKVVDNDLNVTVESFFAAHGSGTGTVKNIIRNTYIGCCMAFSAELKGHILPFPDNLPMHDQWIGLLGERIGKVSLIDTPYLLYRRHDGTATGGATSFAQKLKWRIAIITSLMRK